MHLADNKHLMASFNGASPKAGRLMYHAMPHAAEGSEIRTSDRYGTKIPPHIVKALDLKTHDENYKGGTPLLFATPYLSKALAFGMTKGGSLFNASVPEHDVEILVTCNRDETMSKARDITVYAFPDQGFMDLEAEKRQSVSKHAVPFAAAKVVLHAKNASDLMRAGLQIFSFAESFEDIPSPMDMMKKNNWSDVQYVAAMIKSGKLLWENQARGLNPHPGLAKEMGISLGRADKKLINPVKGAS